MNRRFNCFFKITLLLIAIGLVFSCVNSSTFQKQKLHADHTIFEVNKLVPRADFFAYESALLANEANPNQSGRFLSLDGPWKFQWVPSPRQRTKEFYRTDLDDSGWVTIPVPSNWEVEGYGHPIYLDERYPFTTSWGRHVHKQYTIPPGEYHYAFIIEPKLVLSK